MSPEPIVTGGVQQPITGGEEESQPLYRLPFIIFEALRIPEKRVWVEVLANEAAVTASGGYAKWLHIPRPQRKALTVLEGYEPFTLTVPILFDAVRYNYVKEHGADAAASMGLVPAGVVENVENQIQILEWMAGRGPKKYKPYVTPGEGSPPLVVVYNAKKDTPGQLVPVSFQGALTQWYIDDITWDEHPIRHLPSGARLRQAAIVKLVEYVADNFTAGHPKGPSYVVKEITPSLRSVKALVKHLLAGTRVQFANRLAKAVKETMAINAHNKAIGTNPNKHLKVGTKVRIPSSVVNG